MELLRGDIMAKDCGNCILGGEGICGDDYECPHDESTIKHKVDWNEQPKFNLYEIENFEKYCEELIAAQKDVDDKQTKMKESKKKMCPIKVGYCIKDNCAWFDYNENVCAVLGISKQLLYILEEMP